MRDFAEKLKVELEDLQTEVNAISPLLAKVQTIKPDPIEIRAIAATLHAFYNGAERMYLLIAKEVDRKVPQSTRWRRELLEQMHVATDARPAVVDDFLFGHMIDYLGFRHFFRHSYPMELNWEIMQPLATNLQKCHQLFRESMEHFFAQA